MLLQTAPNYDQLLRTGPKGQPALRFSTTSRYNWLYNDSGSGAHMDVTLWRPNPTDTSFFIIGDYAQGNYLDPTGPSVIVKAINDDPENPLLTAPVDYVQIWNDHGSGGHNDGSVWQPIPLDGYVALGSVGQNGYDKPSIDNYRCVRQDLTTQTTFGALIWNDQGSGAHMDVSLYAITSLSGVFSAQSGYGPPSGIVYKFKST